MTIRVVVADDQELVRAGFAAVLRTQPDLEVVGEAADGREAVDKVRQHRPDVVLMDIRMPRLDGIAATREICGDPHSATRVLVLTTFDLDEYVLAALRAGASGFLLKDAPRQTLYDAVRTVAEGDALLSPSITRRLIETHLRIDEPSPGLVRRLAALTDREREVLTLLARGLTNTEIANALHLSEPTVRTHVGRIYTKTRVRDRAQAVVFAYESELVRSGHASDVARSPGPLVENGFRTD
jgi:DNA-binding NarL/FixJ family response regulator